MLAKRLLVPRHQHTCVGVPPLAEVVVPVTVAGKPGGREIGSQRRMLADFGHDVVAHVPDETRVLPDLRQHRPTGRGTDELLGRVARAQHLADDVEGLGAGGTDEASPRAAPDGAVPQRRKRALAGNEVTARGAPREGQRALQGKVGQETEAHLVRRGLAVAHRGPGPRAAEGAGGSNLVSGLKGHGRFQPVDANTRRKEMLGIGSRSRSLYMQHSD